MEPLIFFSVTRASQQTKENIIKFLLKYIDYLVVSLKIISLNTFETNCVAKFANKKADKTAKELHYIKLTKSIPNSAFSSYIFEQNAFPVRSGVPGRLLFTQIITRTRHTNANVIGILINQFNCLEWEIVNIENRIVPAPVRLCPKFHFVINF